MNAEERPGRLPGAAPSHQPEHRHFPRRRLALHRAGGRRIPRPPLLLPRHPLRDRLPPHRRRRDARPPGKIPGWRRTRPQVSFYGFRSEGHTIDREHPVLATLNECHRELSGQDAASYVSTCTTDLRAFHSFGRGRGTCYGPVAENIHAANERVEIASILQTARAYALFLARWCGLVD